MVTSFLHPSKVKPRSKSFSQPRQYLWLFLCASCTTNVIQTTTNPRNILVRKKKNLAGRGKGCRCRKNLGGRGKGCRCPTKLSFTGAEPLASQTLCAFSAQAERFWTGTWGHPCNPALISWRLQHTRQTSRAEAVCLALSLRNCRNRSSRHWRKTGNSFCFAMHFSRHCCGLENRGPGKSKHASLFSFLNLTRLTRSWLMEGKGTSAKLPGSGSGGCRCKPSIPKTTSEWAQISALKKSKIK